MNEKTFFIPHRLPGLNEVIAENRESPRKGAAMKKEWTELVEGYARKASFKFKGPIEINFLYLEPNRKRDPDNIISAKKFILDGMVNAGMIPNDTQRFIKFFGQDEWDVVKPGETVGVYVQVADYVGTNNKRTNSLDN